MSDELSPERQKQARDLARISRRISILELLLEALLLLAFMFTGASVYLRDLLPSAFVLRVCLYILITGAVFGLLFSPLSYYQGFVLPHRYGLSHQNFSGWLTDQLKGAALVIVLGIAIGVVIYWLLATLPALWWLGAGLFIVALSLLLTQLAPVLIVPLFFKLEPLSDTSLSQRLEELAHRANTKVKGVFTADFSSKSTASNAGLMGLGPTRRIVLSDTLLQQYSPEEIEVVVAHELGHHRHGDIPRLILLQSFLILAAFFLAHLVIRKFSLSLGLAGLSDIANLPLLVLTLGGFLLLIATFLHMLNRHLEMQADRYALRLAPHPEAFVTAMAKLTDGNLSEANPPWWDELLFYDHMPYNKRIARAKAYRQGFKA